MNVVKIEPTEISYKKVWERAEELFFKKQDDYGCSWTILRPLSITDQIWIKAKRIRSIQEKKIRKVTGAGNAISDEFIGIINYSVIGIIALEINGADISVEKVKELYQEKRALVHELFLQKNHDYGEAWRDMRIASMTDLILMKLLRLKQIEDAGISEYKNSEGPVASYQDCINYAIFCLILMEEAEKK